MKILIVLAGFFPGKKYGGPPVSADNFCSLMDSEADCYIVTHNHDLGENTPYHGIKEGWNDRINAKVLYLSDEDYCAKKFKEVITQIEPDYLYLQGLFQKCVIPCLKITKKHGIRGFLPHVANYVRELLRKSIRKYHI